MDRIQAINRGRNIYQDRRCRTSFGVLVNERYDERRHRGERVFVDPLDKTRWAENQIDWLIKQVSDEWYALREPLADSQQGKRIPDDGISREYQLKIPPGDEDEIWQAEIVMSSSPHSRLPTSMRGDDVRLVCTVEAVFPRRALRTVRSGQQVEGYRLVNGHWWQTGHSYILAEFDLSVIVDSTDVKFQLKTKDGRRFSDDHPDIEVQRWQHRHRKHRMFIHNP
jgi:hypothetical protein